jgi:hypothetical protein
MASRSPPLHVWCAERAFWIRIWGKNQCNRQTHAYEILHEWMMPSVCQGWDFWLCVGPTVPSHSSFSRPDVGGHYPRPRKSQETKISHRHTSGIWGVDTGSWDLDRFFLFVRPCSTTDSTLLPKVEGTKLSAWNIYYPWDEVEPTVEKQNEPRMVALFCSAQAPLSVARFKKRLRTNVDLRFTLTSELVLGVPWSSSPRLILDLLHLGRKIVSPDKVKT